LITIKKLLKPSDIPVTSYIIIKDISFLNESFIRKTHPAITAKHCFTTIVSRKYYLYIIKTLNMSQFIIKESGFM